MAELDLGLAGAATAVVLCTVSARFEETCCVFAVTDLVLSAAAGLATLGAFEGADLLLSAAACLFRLADTGTAIDMFLLWFAACILFSDSVFAASIIGFRLFAVSCKTGFANDSRESARGRLGFAVADWSDARTEADFLFAFFSSAVTSFAAEVILDEFSGSDRAHILSSESSSICTKDRTAKMVPQYYKIDSVIF